ncbi:hypothetical protein NLJ89_g8568 [Agrocybe chaxingu]|uniref:Uncharacterized protein n=1 Tax=Agrocybe chaxingu TaxID=84603 RepID=A0A9W8JX96_9AGAR|nr:hypothetical protein NLJ89_g8568 [Agrocybe chaxingu]
MKQRHNPSLGQVRRHAQGLDDLLSTMQSALGYRLDGLLSQQVAAYEHLSSVSTEMERRWFNLDQYLGGVKQEMSLISGQSTRISNMLSSALVGAAEVRALQADATGQAQILTSTLNALTAEAKKGIESINETAISAQKDILNNVHWDTRAWPSRYVIGWLGKGIERILIGSGWLAPNFTVDFEHLDIALEGFMTPGWARALLALAGFVGLIQRSDRNVWSVAHTLECWGVIDYRHEEVYGEEGDGRDTVFAQFEARKTRSIPLS